ncbi:MAG: outer membrane beta-barrel protein [Vicinamibacterales bacterium]
MVALVDSSAVGTAQTVAGVAADARWSIQGAAGIQLAQPGTVRSAAVGFSPTRALMLLIGAEQSRTEDQVEVYADGVASERGGLVQFVSAEVRYAFFATRRLSPYAVVGAGRGVERPNVNELFPFGVDRTIVATYVGAGARLPLHRRLDVFADWRAIVTGDDAAEMAVFMPLRVGVSVRF